MAFIVSDELDIKRYVKSKVVSYEYKTPMGEFSIRKIDEKEQVGKHRFRLVDLTYNIDVDYGSTRKELEEILKWLVEKNS